MRTLVRASVVAACVAAVVFLTPARAAAQWYVGISAGANHTVPATVTVEAPAQNVSLQFHEVHFSARPFASPQYYGWRVGRGLGKLRGVRLGLELEFIHLKVIGDTSQTYVVTAGAAGGSLATSFAAMNTVVQRYQMTHGLNFALVNLVARAPLRRSGGGPISLDLRAGAGPTIPHAETTVLGESKAQYEYAGMGAGGAIGIEVRLHGRLSALGEYKVTLARPEVTLAHGTGRTTALTHHVTIGVIVNLTR
jgi:hypothetical protein